MNTWLIASGIVLTYLAGAASALDALFKSRQPQAKTAWILGLALAPFFALPVYWIFGRRRYESYNELMDTFDSKTGDIRDALDDLQRQTQRNKGNTPPRQNAQSALQTLSRFEFVGGNSGTLLIDGEETFEEIFRAIDDAEKYVLIEFYVIRDDEIGQALQDHLLKALDRDVSVRLLYDGIGSISLTAAYRRRLTEAGAEIAEFSGGKFWLNRFRLNFRNHRKIVIVDGQVAFAGGLNVGDEYLGRDDSIGNWRDTHLRLNGPAVAMLQYIFCRDWYFACQEIPPLNWKPDTTDDELSVLVMASGPNAELENCGLLFAQLIACAETTLWVASPYFVPDRRITSALQLAGLREVDTRILVPRRSDSVFVRFVPFAFFGAVLQAGCRIFFYENDFMHQKVLLVDDDYAVISTANLDNRSFYLNFEVSCIVHDRNFCARVREMLEEDFRSTTEITAEDITARTFRERLATHATELLAPIL